MCTASVISPQHILTASHCLENITTDSQLNALVGQKRIDYLTNGELINVSTYHMHPKYNNSTLEYDIAILELSKSIDHSFVKPITLSSYNSILEKPGTNVKTAGWGVLGENISTEVIYLRETTLSLIDRETCTKNIRKEFFEFYPEEAHELEIDNFIIGGDRICADGNGTGTCYGDSGGPLVVSTPSDDILVGVTSWGVRCGETDVYASVGYAHEFIDKYSKGHQWYPSNQVQSKPTKEPTSPVSSGNQLKKISMFIMLVMVMVFS